ncbi:MAG TPA: PilZ domain-containing protein, partial [Thermoanaerobaculia bacterium]
LQQRGAHRDLLGHVRIAPQRVHHEREYLEGVAENVSLGGMFIATRSPLKEGSLVTLSFLNGVAGAPPVRAKALVCWRRRWSHPRGMGVRFLEFENLGPRGFDGWLQEVLAASPEAEKGKDFQILDASSRRRTEQVAV